MSRQLINEYRAELDKLRQVSGSRRESVLREAFKDLLKRWGRAQDLSFIPEHDIVTPKGNRIYVDGALLHGLRVPFGYWEAKDADDKLDDEIVDKFRKGYPKDNILFTDDHVAVMYQDGHEAGRAAMDDVDALFTLVTRFFAHERAEVADFRKAVKQFAADLPAVLTALRDIIAEKRAASSAFAQAEKTFLKHARDAINPAVSEDDVTEMLIQHVLTEDIFAKVFDNPDFHQSNNIARELKRLEDVLFGYGEKQRLLGALKPYYAGIASTAALISSHSEKQGFLKALYENFYKVYNPKAADKLGVVYTPGEIVRFMIRSADWLCEKHFGKNLIDRGVEILDPATGTGTFIVELLEHFRGDHAKLRHKYKEELHANEVAILPYYVANLNIEATYAAITGQFAEFENLCFVDTLDNVAALGKYAGHMDDMFGGTSDENMGRIKRQNERKISVIIGNPPYNANQQNENDNNKNRTYAAIDERIKATYIKASTAHKTKLYDMYARFYRWASDRLTDDGVLAFVTNRSFIDSRTFDGFRKMVAQDFNDIWVVDLGGDVRVNPRLSGSKHNVFGIQTGVAICFLVRRNGLEDCAIHYVRRPEDETAEDKLSWLGGTGIQNLQTAIVKPNSRQDWVNQADDAEWDNLLQLASRKLTGTVERRGQPTIFHSFSTGFVTARDEWVIGTTENELKNKIEHYISTYQKTVLSLPVHYDGKIDKHLDYQIKWTEDLRKYAEQRKIIVFNEKVIRRTLYRPFTFRWHYFSNDLNWSLYKMPELFPIGSDNAAITTMGDSTGKPYFALAINAAPDLNFVSPGSGGTMTFPRYRYTKSGERVDNITDWAVAQFRGAYPGEALLEEACCGKAASSDVGEPTPAGLAGVGAQGARSPRCAKDAIFAYCYAVLHDPVYRETYALNLKREFPRIPFYADFAQWAAWGETLLKLHIGYEDVTPFALTRTDTPAPKRAEGTHPKPKLKSMPETGTVVVDEDTQLSGIPLGAWDYRLGNRSAIDWVLDQHKEKTPRDPTIRAKFNTYRFVDYKESMIALLAKVVTVSVETVGITSAMSKVDRGG